MQLKKFDELLLATVQAAEGPEDVPVYLSVRPEHFRQIEKLVARLGGNVHYKVRRLQMIAAIVPFRALAQISSDQRVFMLDLAPRNIAEITRPGGV